MNWEALLEQPEPEYRVLPWVGEQRLGGDRGRSWRLRGRPPEWGWWSWALTSREATPVGPTDPDETLLREVHTGYVIGDRFVDEQLVSVGNAHASKFVENLPRVHLLPRGLDRFTRVSIGRVYDAGPFIFMCLEMPLGPEPEVLEAYLERASSVAHLPGVTPALDAAFRGESALRAFIERQQREVEERLLAEVRRRQLEEQLGSAVLRREVAREDFAAGARAALALGGAEFLDHRVGAVHGEFVVRFRLEGRRYECVVDSVLRIRDAGICLTAHYDDPDFEDGTKGDTWLSLEALPAVIREADREGKLVVFRHV